jgi:hypothetical protein
MQPLAITAVSLTCVICALAAGCASDSGVVAESQGNFFITKQGATGFNDVTAIRVEALEEARRFCSGQPGPGNDMFVTRASEIPPGLFGQFPKVEIHFRCGGPSSTAEAAIAECNEKRKRGELKTFKAAVECSNPKVYAAWKEAGDQNLDLLNVLLAARLVGAENVDRGRITESEYQLQLAELNARITEEKRRRSLTDAQARASLQTSQALSSAAQAQSAAALLQGLAALQSANRPVR